MLIVIVRRTDEAALQHLMGVNLPNAYLNNNHANKTRVTGVKVGYSCYFLLLCLSCLYK